MHLYTTEQSTTDCSRLHLLHHAQPVAAPYFFYIFHGKTLAQELAGYVTQLRRVAATYDFAVAVEIGAYAHVVDACNINCVVKVAEKIVEGSLAVASQKAAVHCHLHHSTLCCEGAHLVVGEVARVVTLSAAR